MENSKKNINFEAEEQKYDPQLLEMNNVVNITILYIFSPYKLKPFHEM